MVDKVKTLVGTLLANETSTVAKQEASVELIRIAESYVQLSDELADLHEDLARNMPEAPVTDPAQRPLICDSGMHVGDHGVRFFGVCDNLSMCDWCHRQS
jgi:hypothetical protein